jgi:hypothetical protein
MIAKKRLGDLGLSACLLLLTAQNFAVAAAAA